MISSAQAIFLVTLFFVVSIAGVVWFSRTPRRSISQKTLFSPPKRSFFGQLHMAVSSHCVVLPNIPVSLLVQTKTFSRGESLVSKVKYDTFDYVICDRKTMSVKCIILLEGGDKRKAKDAILSRICRYASIPFLMYDEKPYRNVPVLRREIFSFCGMGEMTLPDSHEIKYEVNVNTKAPDETVAP